MSAKVQLLPRVGLVRSCCLVQTDSARGKELPRRGVKIEFLCRMVLFFSIGYSMEENAVTGETVPYSPSCDFFFTPFLLALLLGNSLS